MMSNHHIQYSVFSAVIRTRLLIENAHTVQYISLVHWMKCTAAPSLRALGTGLPLFIHIITPLFDHFRENPAILTQLSAQSESES